MSEIIYTPHQLPEFAGNPLVEVLNPLPPDTIEKAKLMMRRPKFDKAELNLDSSIRRLCVDRLKNFMFPMGKHIEVLSNIHSQIVCGYRDRNPLTPEGQRSLYQNTTQPSTVTYITGLSGIGKSALIRAVMAATGKQIIEHSEYNGRPCPYSQILYIMQNVPAKSTAKNMCMSLGNELDNLLEKELVAPIFSQTRSQTDFVLGLKKAAKYLRLGALVIDEFHNLNLSRGTNIEEFLAMISNLRDQLGLPIILVGTTAAKNILFASKNISIKRRFCDGGFVEIEPPNSAADDEWYNFCKTMWRYQWIKDHIEFSDEMCQLLYDKSQGITGILLTLFINCQKRAIGAEERIDKTLVEYVYEEDMKPLHAPLEALRSNDPNKIALYDDLYFKAANNVTDFADCRMNEVSAAAETQPASATAQSVSSSASRKKRTPEEIDQMRQEVIGDKGDRKTIRGIFNG